MVNPRLPQLPPYPFQRLATLLEGIPPGRPPVLLSLGEPQHPPPALLTEALARHADLWRPYPPAAGSPRWKAAAAGWLARRFALPADMIPQQAVIPLSGTREGLFLLGALLLEAGARSAPLVVMPDPLYLPYLGGAALQGAEILALPAREEAGFLPDILGLPEDTLARASVVIVCSPSNPEGAIVSRETWRALVTAARQYGFVLVADECYSEIYDHGAPPPGVLEACRDLGGDLKNVLVFNSLSKRSGAAGLRSGLMAGDPALIRAALVLRAYGGPGMPLPVMEASAALWDDETHVAEIRARYRQTIDAAEDRLGGRLGFRRPPGGFFLWLDTAEWDETGEQAARRLWREQGLKVLPGSYICADPDSPQAPGRTRLRLALVHDAATTAQALERLTPPDV